MQSFTSFERLGGAVDNVKNLTPYELYNNGKGTEGASSNQLEVSLIFEGGRAKRSILERLIYRDTFLPAHPFANL